MISRLSLIHWNLMRRMGFRDGGNEGTLLFLDEKKEAKNRFGVWISKAGF